MEKDFFILLVEILKKIGCKNLFYTCRIFYRIKGKKEFILYFSLNTCFFFYSLYFRLNYQTFELLYFKK